MTLILVKIIIPFFVTACTFRAVNEITKVSEIDGCGAGLGKYRGSEHPSLVILGGKLFDQSVWVLGFNNLSIWLLGFNNLYVCVIVFFDLFVWGLGFKDIFVWLLGFYDLSAWLSVSNNLSVWDYEFKDQSDSLLEVNDLTV